MYATLIFADLTRSLRSLQDSSPNSLRTLAARYDFVCFFLWLALTAYSSPLLVSTPILLRTIEFTYARSRARQTMSTNTNSIPPPRAPHAHALTPRIYPLIEFKSGRLVAVYLFQGKSCPDLPCPRVAISSLICAHRLAPSVSRCMTRTNDVR
ncbi:hypothetical protein C8R47DRAFT_725868 [Mycena vitilis]|nr:hypothetical protein C8R47DRAFT_725868 [Mycena vitilis]